MDSHLLKVFVCVAKEKSVSKAALKLNCAQSNVTSRIKQLEKNLGHKLFNRVSKGVKLTSMGEKLYPDALEIVDKMQQTLIKMQNFEQDNILRLASTQVNAPIRLIPLLSDLKKQFKDYKIEVYTNTSLLVIDSILNYDVDIGFICGEPQNKKLKVLKKYEEELYIIDSEEKTEEKCIFTYIDSCIYYKHLLSIQEEKYKDIQTVQIQNYETILACVELGMGKAILPLNLIKKYNYENKLKLTKVQSKKDFSTYLVCRADFNSPINEYLIKE